jgi:tRNA(fMet)-specific endonuclease VapC
VGDKRLVEPLQEASEVFLTSVVVGELVYGLIGGKLEGQNRRLLREFLDSDFVRVAPVDEETAERYAAIRDYLRRKGTLIPTNDLWIAASAAHQVVSPRAAEARVERRGLAAPSRFGTESRPGGRGAPRPSRARGRRCRAGRSRRWPWQHLGSRPYAAALLPACVSDGGPELLVRAVERLEGPFDLLDLTSLEVGPATLGANHAAMASHRT